MAETLDISKCQCRHSAYFVWGLGLAIALYALYYGYRNYFYTEE
jgi:hypothetical protein